MELDDITRMRLHSQALLNSKFHSPAEVMRWMLAMQGQDYAGAKWAVGVRLPGSSDADVEGSLEEKSVVRSWVMRGTLQLVAAEDLLWLLGLLADRIIAGNKRRYGELELDEKTLSRSNTLLAKELQKEKSLTRRELLDLLRREGISTEGQRGVYMLQRASLEGLIAQGVVRSNNATFYSLEGFPQRNLDREEALRELARRYFASRGPATLQDLIWWSGLSAAEARLAVESIREENEEGRWGDQTYWWSGSLHATGRKTQSGLLLPTFDEYLIAYQDRRAALGERKFAQLSPGGGMLPGTIVLNGKVRGIWKRTVKAETVVLSTTMYEPISAKEERQVIAAAREYGRFLGRKAAME